VGGAWRDPGSAMWEPLEGLLVLTDVLRLVCSLTRTASPPVPLWTRGRAAGAGAAPRAAHLDVHCRLPVGLASLLVGPLSPGALLFPWYGLFLLVGPLSPGTLSLSWYGLFLLVGPPSPGMPPALSCLPPGMAPLLGMASAFPLLGCLPLPGTAPFSWNDPLLNLMFPEWCWK